MRSTDLKIGTVVYVAQLLAPKAYLLEVTISSAVANRQVGAKGVVRYQVAHDPTLWVVMHDSEFGGLLAVYKACELTTSLDSLALLRFVGAKTTDEYEKSDFETGRYEI